MLIPRERFFYPILTQKMDSFSCSPLNTSFFFLEKHEKGFQKIPKTLKCDMMMSFQHDIDITDRHAASVLLFVFYLSHGPVWVCEIELSHMGKNNGNPNLVYENMPVCTSPEPSLLAYTKYGCR